MMCGDKICPSPTGSLCKGPLALEQCTRATMSLMLGTPDICEEALELVLAKGPPPSGSATGGLRKASNLLKR